MLRKSPNAADDEVPSLPTISGVISYRQHKAMLAPGIQFPDGIVKKTWAYGYPRQDDIKIEEVFQKDDLELAILSSFQWDDEWVLSKLNLRKTKVICVVQADREEQVGKCFCLLLHGLSIVSVKRLRSQTFNFSHHLRHG
jgi:hypothetical protein